MHQPVMRYGSTQEPLDDEEGERMDPDNWDWNNAYEIDPSPDPRLILEVRLAGDDLKHIERAAIAEGMTVTAYLQLAAVRCAVQRIAQTSRIG